MHNYDIAKIRSSVFNLSGGEYGNNTDKHWCSKYLKTVKILLRGESNNVHPNNPIISAYDMKNGNFIGKII